MKRYSLTIIAAISGLVAMTASATANDLIDLLTTVQQITQQRGHSPLGHRGGLYRHLAHQPGYRGVGHSPVSGLSSRDLYKRRLGHLEAYSRMGYHFSADDRYDLLHSGRHPFPYRRTPVLSVRLGSQGHPIQTEYLRGGDVTYPVLPVAPVSPVPPVPGLSVAPIPRQPSLMPHRIGEIIDCPVQLATCIRVKDPDHIAPDAVPTVVAVRDPNLCRHKCKCCIESVVYVEVCLPPCPPRKLRISPCGTYICMNYGKYQVELTSRKGLITIDYDD
jgi:hypothetical protein